jgi:hypothetical protein
MAPPFLSLALDSGELHAPAALPPGKEPGTYCMGGWVGRRGGVGDVEYRKLLLLPEIEP